MSTALVSNFYDVGELLSYQNRQFGSVDHHKAVGSHLMSHQNVLQRATSSSRHSSTSALTVRNSPVSMKLTPPSSPPISETSGFTTLTGRDHRLGNIFDATQSAYHRKVDRTFSEPGPIDNRTALTTNNNNNNNNNNNTVNSSRYKTEMCRPFEESGHCKYGDKCQFAHGAHELRTVNRHPKFKTELCRTFHTVGFCPYGPRCHFIHNDEELKMSQMMKNQQAASQAASRGQPLQRPKALNFTSFHLPLGSTADSPPSSVGDSPSLSPVFMEEQTYTPQQIQTAPPCSMASTKFTFPPPSEIIPSPTGLTSPFDSQVASLLQAGSRNTNINEPSNNSIFSDDPMFGAVPTVGLPPSPPSSLCGDNICGSPLDVSRNLRLPIFSQLSIHDDC